VAIEEKATPLFTELVGLAEKDIDDTIDPDLYSERFNAFIRFRTVAAEVLKDPVNTPGVRPMNPADGRWNNLYVFRSEDGWHLVYCYNESEGATRGERTGTFLAVLLFDHNGEPVRSVLERLRSLLRDKSALPGGASAQLAKIFDSADPIAELFRAIGKPK
jgi:hypothetical protein